MTKIKMTKMDVLPKHLTTESRQLFSQNGNRFFPILNVWWSSGYAFDVCCKVGLVFGISMPTYYHLILLNFSLTHFRCLKFNLSKFYNHNRILLDECFLFIHEVISELNVNIDLIIMSGEYCFSIHHQFSSVQFWKHRGKKSKNGNPSELLSGKGDTVWCLAFQAVNTRNVINFF